MHPIDNMNIQQLVPPRKRTWAVYVDENVEKKFFLQEVEFFALVETVRPCEYEVDSPYLYIGDVPCVRDTWVCPLYLHDNFYLDEVADPDLLGYTHNPREDWSKAAEAHLARRAESKEREAKREAKRKPIAYASAAKRNAIETAILKFTQ
jgi:hypothetical protein